MRLLQIVTAVVVFCGDRPVSAQAPPSMPGEGPQLRLWLLIKQSLQAKDGQRYFEDNLKEAFLPGGADGVFSFSGTVLSNRPANNPEAVILGLSDTHTPEVKVRFVDQHGKVAHWGKPIASGTKVAFAGFVKEFTKEPFMLTFDVDLGHPKYGSFSILEATDKFTK